LFLEVGYNKKRLIQSVSGRQIISNVDMTKMQAMG